MLQQDSQLLLLSKFEHLLSFVLVRQQTVLLKKALQLGCNSWLEDGIGRQCQRNFGNVGCDTRNSIFVATQNGRKMKFDFHTQSLQRNDALPAQEHEICHSCKSKTKEDSPHHTTSLFLKIAHHAKQPGGITKTGVCNSGARRTTWKADTTGCFFSIKECCVIILALPHPPEMHHTLIVSQRTSLTESGNNEVQCSRLTDRLTETSSLRYSAPSP